MHRVFAAALMALFLWSCSAEMPATEYSAEGERLLGEGQYIKAREVLGKGIYQYPDDYALNFAMGRAVLATSKRFIPGDRGLYIARHYFGRAMDLAPDREKKDAARAEYSRIIDLQGLSR